MNVAIIADDLTGAADTGVQFTRAGYRTAVAFWGSPVPPEKGLDAVALDTESRTMAAGFAAKRVLKAARAVREACLVYKKIDSTLRGPIAAELSAALEATGRSHAVVGPAFPSTGRITREGVQLVDGVPVHETAVGRDPHTPVRESHLPTLLEETASPVVGLSVEEAGDPKAVLRALEDARIVVADADSDANLEALVRAIPDPSRVLWVGSAGLALALGTVYAGPRLEETPEPSESARGILVVVGSLNEVSREQLHRLVEERGGATPVVAGGPETVKEAVAAARAALSEGVYVAICSEEEGSSGAGRSFAETLAEVVAGLEGEGLFDALVLTGGDTAISVARRLGVAGIRLQGEVEPGIPVGTFIGPVSYRVVTKAGGFGEPDTLARVVEALRHGEKG